MSKGGTINEKGLPQENKPLQFRDTYGIFGRELTLKKRICSLLDLKIKEILDIHFK